METMAGTFFNWLLRTSWQASLLAIIVLVVQWTFQKKLAARWRHALWLVVVTRLLLPVSPGSALSIFNYLPLANHVSQSSMPADAPLIKQTSPPEAKAPAAFATIPSGPIQLPAQAIALNSAKPGLSASVTPRGLLLYGEIFWIAGVLMLALRMAGQNIVFARRLRSAKTLSDPAIIAVFNQCQAGFGIRRAVRLAETDAVASPALHGLFHPALLLPKALLATFSPRELRYIFLHELAHVRRHDMAVHWLATALKALHWFNPVLWFAFRRMAADRELACDELALEHAREQECRPYGETIVKLLEQCARQEPLTGLLGILEDKDQMVRRISMITNFKPHSRWSCLALLLLPALGLVTLTDAQPQRAGQAASPASPPAHGDTAIVVTAGLLADPAGPSYRGKSAEQWFGQIDFWKGTFDPDFVAAEAAFRGMGAAALPFLREKLVSKLSTRGKPAEPRRAAIWLLRELGPLAIRDLISILNDRDGGSAALALAEVGAEARPAVPALLESFRSGNGPAAEALARIDPGNPALVAALIEVLDKPHAPTQLDNNAMWALAILGPRAKAAIPELRRALADKETQGFAALALQRIASDQPEVVAEVAAVMKARLPAHGNSDIAKLIDAVESADPSQLGELGEALEAARSDGSLISPVTIRRVLDLASRMLDSGLAENSHPLSLSKVLYGLGPQAAPLVPKMLAALEDDSGAWVYLLRPLNRISPGDKRALPVLIRLLDDSNFDVRQNACLCLTSFGSEAREAVPTLRQRLNDDSPDVKFRASLALWRITGEVPPAPFLQEALRQDRSFGPSYVGLRTIEMLASLNQQTDETLSIVTRLAQHDDVEVRTNALALLRKFGKAPPATKEL